MNLPKTSFNFQLFSLNRERNTDTHYLHTWRASNFSIFKRLLNLSLVIIGVIICSKLWLVHNKQQSLWYHQQANQLGRSLAQLSAQTMVKGIIEQDEQSIVQQISYLTNNDYVLGVALYNQKGQLIQQVNAEKLISDGDRESTEPTLTFIQEVRSDKNDIIGYLRVLLDETKVMQFHFDYQQQMIEIFEVLLLLAALAGGIVTRAFYTIRYRQYRRRLKEDSNSSDIL
jgi:membrane protein